MRGRVELSAGSSFAGYRIEALVGRGGMGVVYRATELRLERTVALKLIAPELAEDERFRERFLRESRLAASLEHSNILPVYAAGEEDGALYLAMRYVEGSDLRTLLDERRRLEPDRALTILAQVAAALDAAHGLGLVHRDVKPGNVLLDAADHVYLADFGLTKRLGDGSGATQTGQIVGTIDYLAPEQIRGEEVDGRADQYALGCVLYECLAGEAPFRRETEAATLWAHMQDEPPTLAGYRTLDAVLAKALAKDKAVRHPSCRGFIGSARAALGLDAAPARPLLPPALLRHGRMLALAGALLLAVGIAAAVVELTRGRGGGLPILAANSIGEIDTKTNRVVAQIPAAGTPARLAVESRTLWVGSDDSGTVSALDPTTDRVSTLVATGGFPSDLAVGEGAVWVVDGKRGLLAKIEPTYGVAGRVRIADANPVYDVSRSGFDPTSVAAGAGSVWVTNGTQKLVRVDPAASRVVERIDLHRPLNGVAVGGGAVWAISGASATAIRLDRRGRETVRIPIVSKPGFESPYPLAVEVGEGSVWVLNANTATVTKIDPDQRAVTATIPIGIERGPARLAVGDGAAWVANSDGTLARIDASTNALRIIPVGHRLKDVAVGSDAVWVTTGSGLSGSEGATVTGGQVRALPASSCSPIYYEGGGHPHYVIASDLPLQGSGTTVPQMSQAIQYILRQHRFRAGRFTVAYQSCDDSTAPQGYYSSEKCAANARAYARDASVIGVIGTFNSGCAEEVIPILNQAPRGPLAMISPANTLVGLTHSGPGAAPDEPRRYYPTGVRNYARIIATDDLQAAANALLARQLGVRRVYVLHDDEPYGKAIAAYFGAAAVKLGIRIVGESGWALADKSYVQVAATVARAKPDGVFLGGVGGFGSNGGTLIKDLRVALPASVRLMAPDGFTPIPVVVANAGPAAEGMTVSVPGIANDRLPEAGKKFVAAFSKAVGEAPVQWSAAAAQAAEVLLDAIARSDGTRASVTGELFKTKVSNGILGSFSFDANGDTTTAAVTIYRVVSGAPTLLRVITPPRRLVE